MGEASEKKWGGIQQRPGELSGCMVSVPLSEGLKEGRWNLRPLRKVQESSSLQTPGLTQSLAERVWPWAV